MISLSSAILKHLAKHPDLNKTIEITERLNIRIKSGKDKGLLNHKSVGAYCLNMKKNHWLGSIMVREDGDNKDKHRWFLTDHAIKMLKENDGDFDSYRLEQAKKRVEKLEELNA